jgi:hypothetical protein
MAQNLERANSNRQAGVEPPELSCLPPTVRSCPAIQINPECLTLHDLYVDMSAAHELVAQSQVRAPVTADERIGLVQQANLALEGAGLPHLELQRTQNPTSMQK